MSWFFPLAVMADTQRAQYLAVAGFVMLGWVLARRSLKMRKRVNQDTQVAHKELVKLRGRKDPVMPLSDAPVETQRWTVGMFDLQRELKAELDTRIVIVQTLLRQLDAKIDRLSRLEKSFASDVTPTHVAAGQRGEIEAMLHRGHTAEEIATAIGLPIGDVELTIATTRVG